MSRRPGQGGGVTRSLQLGQRSEAPRDGDSDTDDGFDFLDDTIPTGNVPGGDGGNRRDDPTPALPPQSSALLVRRQKQPTRQTHVNIPEFQVSLPNRGDKAFSNKQKFQTLPAGLSRPSAWDRESSDSEDATGNASDPQALSGRPGGGTEETDGGGSVESPGRAASPRTWRRRGLRSPMRSQATVTGATSPTVQRKRPPSASSHLGDDLTGSGFDHGSQTSIQLQHARLGEASDTEVDNAHPSFSVSTTESMYAHVPLSELVKDLPHIKKEMVCVLYRETLTTIMSRLGADERPEVSVRSLVHYADQLFNIPPAVSKSWVADINSTACKASQLIVDVIEAKGLAAMDANGFSDPYVLLSIEQPQSTKTDVANIIKAVTCDQDDSTYGFSVPSMPSIQSEMAITSVVKMTLNPKWNESHTLKIHDPATDNLQIFIMDRDDTQDTTSIRFSLKGLKEGLRHALKSGGDDFLGRATIPLESITYSGCDYWWPLRQEHTEQAASGEIRIKLSFKLHTTPQPPTELSNTDILQQLRMTMMLRENENSEHTFTRRNAFSQSEGRNCSDYESPNDEAERCRSSGTKPICLSPKAEFLLGQFVTQRQMPAASVAYANWRVNLDMFMAGRIMYPAMIDALQMLNINVVKIGLLQDKEEACLAESLDMFVNRTLQAMKFVKATFPFRVDPKEDGMVLMVSSLRMVYAMPVWLKYFPDRAKPKEDIGKALEVRVAGLYAAASKEAKMDVETLDDVCTCIEKMKTMVDLLLGTFQRIQEHYGNIFSKVHLDYHTFVMKQLDKLYSEDIKQVINTAMKLMAETKCREEVFRVSLQLYNLFICVREFAGKVSSVPLSPGETLQSATCHQWFTSILPFWLDCWETKTLEQVTKAVEIDQMEKTNTASAAYSSSAIDVLTIFSRLRTEMKELLEWPDAITNFTIVVKVTDMLCKFALQYATMTHNVLVKRLQASEKLVIIDSKVCIPISNIEHMRSEGIGKIPKHLRFEHVIMQVYSELQADAMNGSSRTEVQQAYSGTLTRLVGRTSEQMECCSAPAFNQLCKQIGQKIRRIFREFDRKPIETVLTLCYDTLETNIRVLRDGTPPKAYKRFIIRLWQMVVRIVHDMVSEKVQRPPSYYSALQSAMTTTDAKQGLFWFFMTQTRADIRGKNLDTPELNRLRIALQRQTLPTEALVLEYYHQVYLEYAEQMAHENNLGSLSYQCALLESPTVRTAKTRAFRINVLHYKDIPNPGKEDMAVFMTGMLCPQPCSQSATPPSSFKSIVSHGVSAFIDETFDLSVSSDLIRKRGLNLRICAYKKVSITTADILLGVVMIPLDKLHECSPCQFSSLPAETREFVLNLEASDRPTIKDIHPVLELRSTTDQEAKKVLADEKAFSAAITKLQAKKSVAAKDQ